jgi:hypothetical protein
MNTAPDTRPAPPIRIKISEVKYSLPEMLEELKDERASGSFAMEQLDQGEIAKIFKTKTRAKSQR